ncbi:hypothetical protein A3A76_05735 [Candidatus Woesebacteria bacterium RIFCSPLOWO2_01_FULL_39_23]|uniref:Uncharacterized protein n=1 Tax=Candidatus Woesebacteria bacterium RIFCSPHIGHO2_01_FULL_40_22 TaxID=1802499 RepID=A0A1F7YI08_9BACT|nr:MAG: hypothetical protein A2141_02065 [Candidatus Woesebacteria bacterium RBG_16_40_11]OGM26902.1 MAG: hypothetical protein A2628_05675 [Candidatus Woesebacteria bacterium RIFCSPHIGHO2_01_FULL_40_22]OGM38469.1 MAG: hypothetical protein A3E41_01385 [Candidatus Woesebacteria bacterium RIFCSPHIGHO2_12_FULL_38_9]OGM63177.1 MAG: hypothetical protein A3A76_05735 [Candidatus Woesebacteria bacterium RIFCSPLOWO2_01_FULL_39_23]
MTLPENNTVQVNYSLQENTEIMVVEPKNRLQSDEVDQQVKSVLEKISGRAYEYSTYNFSEVLEKYPRMSRYLMEVGTNRFLPLDFYFGVGIAYDFFTKNLREGQEISDIKVVQYDELLGSIERVSKGDLEYKSRVEQGFENFPDNDLKTIITEVSRLAIGESEIKEGAMIMWELLNPWNLKR